VQIEHLFPGHSTVAYIILKCKDTEKSGKTKPFLMTAGKLLLGRQRTMWIGQMSKDLQNIVGKSGHRYKGSICDRREKNEHCHKINNPDKNIIDNDDDGGARNNILLHRAFLMYCNSNTSSVKQNKHHLCYYYTDTLPTQGGMLHSAFYSCKNQKLTSTVCKTVEGKKIFSLCVHSNPYAASLNMCWTILDGQLIPHGRDSPEKLTVCTAGQETHHLLQRLKVHYCVNNSPPLVTTGF
jgi:hypothetical protein